MNKKSLMKWDLVENGDAREDMHTSATKMSTLTVLSIAAVLLGGKRGFRPWLTASTTVAEGRIMASWGHLRRCGDWTR